MIRPALPLLLLAIPASALPEAPPAQFRAQTIDAELKIGYGVAIADVDGDGKPDIVLADARETRWYRNPNWQKHTLTGSLTQEDHVCIAARDIDGDQRAEIAVGGEWNPGDTLTSGAVFSLEAPADRSTPWKSTRLHHEPTVHRMNWVKERESNHFLAVLPLHGCGNKNGEGAGIRFLGYQPPNATEKDWQHFLIHEGFHMAHNFQPLVWQPGDKGESMLVAEKEGIHLISKQEEQWKSRRLTTRGAGEVQVGKLPDGGRFIATIEPMHGNQVVIYPEKKHAYETRILADDTLKQGHALVAADFLGLGYDQVAAGWREKAGDDQKVGIRLYIPTDESGATWKLHSVIDDNKMACEDMKAADLNGDGCPELIASGRATRNLVIYWNDNKSSQTVPKSNDQ